MTLNILKLRTYFEEKLGCFQNRDPECTRQNKKLKINHQTITCEFIVKVFLEL